MSFGLTPHFFIGVKSADIFLSTENQYCGFGKERAWVDFLVPGSPLKRAYRTSELISASDGIS
jgi:hypothetical protein